MLNKYSIVTKLGTEFIIHAYTFSEAVKLFVRQFGYNEDVIRSITVR